MSWGITDYHNSEWDKILAAQEESVNEKLTNPEPWRDIVGALSDGMLVFGGQKPVYGPERDRAREFQKRRTAKAVRGANAAIANFNDTVSNFGLGMPSGPSAMSLPQVGDSLGGYDPYRRYR
jgi:hypothetical protein